MGPLEPQEELQRTNQDGGHAAGSKEKQGRGELAQQQHPGKQDGSLRKLERKGLDSFHVRSLRQSASPLPQMDEMTIHC